jgi:hypothetical protein
MTMPVQHHYSRCTRFFHEELSWSQSKVDDLLLPIIRKMGQRGQVGRKPWSLTIDELKTT